MDIRNIVHGYNSIATVFNSIADMYESCNCDATYTPPIYPVVLIDEASLQNLNIPQQGIYILPEWEQLVCCARDLVRIADRLTPKVGGPKLSIIPNSSCRLFDDNCNLTQSIGEDFKWGDCLDTAIQSDWAGVGTTHIRLADTVAQNFDIKLVNPADINNSSEVLEDYLNQIEAMASQDKLAPLGYIVCSYGADIAYAEYDRNGHGKSKAYFKAKADDLYSYVKQKLNNYFNNVLTTLKNNPTAAIPVLDISDYNDPDNVNFEITTDGSGNSIGLQYQKVTIRTSGGTEPSVLHPEVIQHINYLKPSVRLDLFNYADSQNSAHDETDYWERTYYHYVPVLEYGTAMYGGNPVGCSKNVQVWENVNGTLVPIDFGNYDVSGLTPEERARIFDRLSIEVTDEEWKSFSIDGIGGMFFIVFNPTKSTIHVSSLLRTESTNTNLVCEANDHIHFDPTEITDDLSTFKENTCGQYTYSKLTEGTELQLQPCDAAFFGKVIPETYFEAGSAFGRGYYPKLDRYAFVNNSERLFNSYLYDGGDYGPDYCSRSLEPPKHTVTFSWGVYMH